MTFTPLFFSFKYFPVPLIVPPVPTPAIKCVTKDSLSFYEDDNKIIQILKDIEKAKA